MNVNITSSGSLVTFTNLVSISTNSGQNWLSEFNSGTTGVVTVSANPAFFSGTSDTGTVTLSTSAGQLSFQVILTITSAGSVGLVATPNPIPLNVSVAGSTATQNVNVTYNGSPTAVSNVSVFTSGGQNWLQAFQSGATGGITVNAITTSGLFGSYTGTVTVSTQFGSLSIPVNLTVGTSGNSSGLVASPSVLNYNVPIVGPAATPPSQTLT